MKKDNIFSIVAMGCGLLIILSVFLPYISYYGTSISLWKAENPARILYILLGLLVIGMYLINKKTELSYLTVGFAFFNSITDIISMEGFEGLSIGFYLILLSSIAIGVMTFLYDENSAIALINLSVSVNKPVVANQMNYNQPNMNMQQPVMNQPQQVINNNQSMYQPIQPQVQPEPVITGYDPMTGAPIHSNTKNN